MYHLLALLTLSQAAEPSAQAAPENLWNTVLQIVLAVSAPALVWVVKSCGNKWASWMAQKTGSEFVGHLTHNALVLVTSLYQSQVKNLKKNGGWNAEAKEELKNQAMIHLEAISDPKRLKEAAGALGIPEYLGHHVDSAVNKAKAVAKAAGAADPTKG